MHLSPQAVYTMPKIDRICPICEKPFQGTKYVRTVYCGVQCHKYHLRDPKRAEAHFWARVDKNGPNGCWLFMGCRDKWGYGDLNYMGKHIQAHRLAWKLLRGDPSDLDVLHDCDNPPCCNPDHAYLGTDQDNANDRVSRGRLRLGEMSPQAKLTEEQARRILALKGKERSIELAEKYGVCQTTITGIWAGRSWQHIHAS